MVKGRIQRLHKEIEAPPKRTFVSRSVRAIETLRRPLDTDVASG
jgi:hypothetical protein